MSKLLEIHINLQRTTDLLERIAVALERLAGPPLPPYSPPKQATLRDYALVTDQEAAAAQSAMSEHAALNMLVPGSPAHLAAIREFEELIRSEGGDDAVDSLPWRIRTGAKL